LSAQTDVTAFAADGPGSMALRINACAAEDARLACPPVALGQHSLEKLTMNRFRHCAFAQ